MLINKLPCLDKGYVAYLDSSGNSSKLKDVALEFFKRTDGKFLTDLSTLTVVMKCPLFVQLNLSTVGLKIISVPASEVEAYVPNVGEIGSPNHETNKTIAEDMYRTTEALLINPRAYQHDGCERFVSQVMTPISAYTTLIVHGSYNEWRRFCDQNGMPSSTAAFANAVKQIMSMEWR
jgi:hypothetical protein